MIGSIQKKGKSYYVVFRVTDPKTKLKKQKWIAVGKKKKDAEEKFAEFVGDVNSGVYRDTKKATFAEFSERWLNIYAEMKTKPSTFKSYKDIISNHLIPYMGDYHLRDIDTSLLQEYVALRLKKVKPKTVINELVPVKEMFKHAVKWGYLKTNPAEGVERPRVEKEEMQVLTPDEVKQFLEHVTLRYRTFFLTAILTGLRRGELLGLQGEDIDWNHNQIHVRRSLWKGQIVSPKTKSSVRRVDTTPTLAQELRRHKLSCSIEDSGFVFCNSEGKPLDPDSLVKRQFLPALKRAGVKRVRFHDLRHLNVALRLEQGQNIKYIQNQLGHASIQTTIDRYGHLLREVNTEQAMKLDNALNFTEHLGDSSDSVRRLLEDC
jgi:integrase